MPFPCTYGTDLGERVSIVPILVLRMIGGFEITCRGRYCLDEFNCLSLCREYWELAALSSLDEELEMRAIEQKDDTKALLKMLGIDAGDSQEHSSLLPT